MFEEEGVEQVVVVQRLVVLVVVLVVLLNQQVLLPLLLLLLDHQRRRPGLLLLLLLREAEKVVRLLCGGCLLCGGGCVLGVVDGLEAFDVEAVLLEVAGDVFARDVGHVHELQDGRGHGLVDAEVVDAVYKLFVELCGPQHARLFPGRVLHASS